MNPWQEIARFSESGTDVVIVTVAAARGSVPGEAGAVPPVATPPPVAAAQGGGESINPDEPWRNQVPRPGAARPLQLATPVSAKLANGLTLILSERRGLPVVAAEQTPQPHEIACGEQGQMFLHDLKRVRVSGCVRR